MCQAYEAEWHLVNAMENYARRQKIEDDGYRACWRGVPRECNAEIPESNIKYYGLEKATEMCLTGASSYWYKPNLLSWWWGWDRACKERQDMQEPAGDVRMVK